MPEFDSTLEYRDIQGWPGYCIGSDGMVWSAWGLGYRKTIGNNWKPLSQWTHLGYRFVALCRRNFDVHTLMLRTFVGPRPPGCECRHLDGDRSNNHISNLCWGTRTENARDRIRHGTQVRGERQGQSKLTAEDVAAAFRMRAEGLTQREIGEKLGICQSHVSDILHGKKWTHVTEKTSESPRPESS